MAWTKYDAQRNLIKPIAQTKIPDPTSVPSVPTSGMINTAIPRQASTPAPPGLIPKAPSTPVQISNLTGPKGQTRQRGVKRRRN